MLKIMSDTLHQITALGTALREYKHSLELKLKEVEELKDHIKEIEENLLPTLMDDTGLEEITLNDGSKIKCGDFIVARIQDQDTAFQWLRETQNEGIIKNEIKIELARGDDEQAKMVADLLDEKGIPATRKESVHYQTLNAFVREALNNPELQDTLPKKAFGVYETRKVSIK